MLQMLSTQQMLNPRIIWMDYGCFLISANFIFEHLMLLVSFNVLLCRALMICDAFINENTV